MKDCKTCPPAQYGDLNCMGCDGEWGFYRLVLPWPPSVNHYWRHVVIGRSVRTLISAEGRAYKTRVELACREQQAPIMLQDNLAVTIRLEPPDRRKRDIDNSIKAVFDSLTSARVWGDDFQVDDLHVYRTKCVKNGRVTVEIRQIGGE